MDCCPLAGALKYELVGALNGELLHDRFLGGRCTRASRSWRGRSGLPPAGWGTDER